MPIKRSGVTPEEKLVVVVKSLGEDEERYGSVTFLLQTYFSSNASELVPGQRYVNWVTLFDHPDDDIYDGIIGEDDDELPRIQMEFVVTEA